MNAKIMRYGDKFAVERKNPVTGKQEFLDERGARIWWPDPGLFDSVEAAEEAYKNATPVFVKALDEPK